VQRFGLIGDVHAEDELLAVTLVSLAAAGLDAILCTGDLADGPGSVDRCRELLEAHGVQVVSGNHDRWLRQGRMRDLPDATDPAQLSPATLAYLAALPSTRDLETSRGLLHLCHGVGSNDMGRLLPDDEGYGLETNSDLQRLIHEDHYATLVAGHTHRRMVRRFHSLLALNPGTLHRAEEPGFLIVDLEAGMVLPHQLSPDGAVTRGEAITLP